MLYLNDSICPGRLVRLARRVGSCDQAYEADPNGRCSVLDGLDFTPWYIDPALEVA
jgi:hypothetical protein